MGAGHARQATAGSSEPARSTVEIGDISPAKRDASNEKNSAVYGCRIVPNLVI